MLRGSSQYTLRYHLTAIYREVIIRDKYIVIIVVSHGFREAFSLLPSCLCGFIWRNTIEMGGFGKNTCFSDEIQCPYEDFCNSLSHLCHGKGMCFPIHPNCYNVWTESFKTIPTDFLLSREVFVGTPQLPQCMGRVIQYTPHSISTKPIYTNMKIMGETSS